MLQNILSSILGSHATVDIALYNAANTAGGTAGSTSTSTSSAGNAGSAGGAAEEGRARPGGFVFRRSFVWSSGPPEGAAGSAGTDGPAAPASSAGTASPAGSAGDAQTARVPVQDLAAFLENAFGSGFSEEGFAASPLSGFFSNVFTMRNPGDYVWSSTGFDNIITQLMEQYPSTNAPPPASEEVINALPKTVVEKEEEGGVAGVFHDNCVIPWLKINNTCVICRATVGTNVLNQSSNHSESDRKEKDDKSKDSSHNMEEQLEQEPPD
ncbi:hypothetical protein PORY_002011 [Pneumocystis oryctolagi]|uniref:Uncharacterized protein n=1 Tax=Pneumocystis oryctolagi TaxID=42067 RepID=A0ACB7CAN7_9ASCO|nr:hypothetical protein PORY_002011 [Pneumocystis oryctolagi]